MKKLTIISIALLFSLTIFSFIGVQVKAATVEISPTSWVMDVDQSSDFTAIASGIPPFTYQWYINDLLQAESSSTFTFTPDSAGSYLINVTVTDFLLTTASSATYVTVNPSPEVSISPSGPIALNIGQIQNFTANANGGSGTSSYQWYLNGGAVGSNSADYSYTATSGSHTVTCSITDSASVPVTNTSNTVSITVNNPLTPPVLTANPSIITQGQSSTLTSTSMNTGTSPYTYQWFEKTPGASAYSIINGANSPTYSFVTSVATPTGSWSFILQVNDSASQTVNSSAIPVTVNLAKVDHFSISNIGTQTAGVLFTISITAYDENNNTLQQYNNVATLNVSTGNITPTVTGAFINGVWTGQVNLTKAGSEIRLTVFDSSGMTGVSNAFIVKPGTLDHFFISTIGTITNSSSFNMTVLAKDSFNNTVTNYVGAPLLSFSAGLINPQVMNAFINGQGSISVTIYATGSSGIITVYDDIKGVRGLSNSFTITFDSGLPAISFESALAVGIIIPEIILIYSVIAFKRLKQKPERA